MFYLFRNYYPRQHLISGHIEYSRYHFLFELLLLHLLNLFHPIFDESFLFKCKDNLIEFILNLEMKRHQLIIWFFIVLQFSSLYEIIGSVILVLFIQVNVNEVFAHNGNILFPYFRVGIFHMNVPYFAGFTHNLRFFDFQRILSIIFNMITLLKAFVYFQEIAISEFINLHLQLGYRNL